MRGFRNGSDWIPSHHVPDYSTAIKKTSPGAILGSIFSKSVENFHNIRNESFLEIHLVYISVC